MTKWITTNEAAELMGVDASTIRKWAIGGKIARKKFGRDWMIDQSSLNLELRSPAGKQPVRQPKLTPKN